MIKLTLLPTVIEPENFARGVGKHDRVARMGVTELGGRAVICFDNSEEEYGTMYIDLEDLRRIIDRIETLDGGEKPKMIGKLKMRYGLQGLVDVRKDTPVYEMDGKYFVEAGLVRVPFSAKSLPEIEFI